MSKKIAIMQPYFFPYIGYFQLISAVDEFIIYDNIQYTKKGWINRNRILMNGREALITLPIKKDSDYLDVIDRTLSENWYKEKSKFLNIIYAAYKKAPVFNQVFEVIENCINVDEQNLFKFVYHSICSIKSYLNIATPLIISSKIDINHNLKSQDKVIALCQARYANMYINSVGGIELYNKDVFIKKDIELNFLKPKPIIYHQFDNEFISWLSVIDVMMFNSKEQIQQYLKEWTYI